MNPTRMNKKSGSRPAVRYLLNYHFTLDKYEQDGLASKPQLAITEDLLFNAQNYSYPKKLC